MASTPSLGMAGFYTGVGSRSTPIDILDLMTRIAIRLDADGYWLRSGNAEGADQAFATGHALTGNMEIYLPWRTFNRDHPSLHHARYVYERPTRQAFNIARRYHPAWERLAPGGQDLHARNVHQVLGIDCDRPARFLICWTPNADGSGGTGQALRIARAYHVPTFDLGNPDTLTRLQRYVAGEVASPTI